MAYKIQYSPQDNCRYPMQKTHRPVKWGRGVAAAAILAAGLWIHSHGVPDFLIPGDPQVTKTAAAELMLQMKEGIAMEEAVTAFCRQILDGAGD